MTTFNFRHKKTGKEIEIKGTIADAEAYEKAHPHMDWMPGKPLIHSGLGLKKPDQGWTDTLQRIKKANPQVSHAINDFGRGNGG